MMEHVKVTVSADNQNVDIEGTMALVFVVDGDITVRSCVVGKGNENDIRMMVNSMDAMQKRLLKELPFWFKLKLLLFPLHAKKEGV